MAGVCRGPGRTAPAGEPLQYVLGTWPFRTLELLVDPRVLIPRPETETVVEVALAELRPTAPDGPTGRPVVADLGHRLGRHRPVGRRRGRTPDRGGWRCGRPTGCPDALEGGGGQPGRGGPCRRGVGGPGAPGRRPLVRGAARSADREPVAGGRQSPVRLGGGVPRARARGPRLGAPGARRVALDGSDGTGGNGRRRGGGGRRTQVVGSAGGPGGGDRPAPGRTPPSGPPARPGSVRSGWSATWPGVTGRWWRCADGRRARRPGPGHAPGRRRGDRRRRGGGEIPTDTVYGFAVDPRRPDAVERVFAQGTARRRGPPRAGLRLGPGRRPGRTPARGGWERLAGDVLARAADPGGAPQHPVHRRSGRPVGRTGHGGASAGRTIPWCRPCARSWAPWPSPAPTSTGSRR